MTIRNFINYNRKLSHAFENLFPEKSYSGGFPAYYLMLRTSLQKSYHA